MTNLSRDATHVNSTAEHVSKRPHSQESIKVFRAALTYAEVLHWHVFPCHHITDAGQCSCGNPKCSSPGKHPRTPHGVSDTTTDPEIIRQWGEKWPEANIGIATGAISGFDALDIDTQHGGDDSLGDLIEECGPLPETVEALTPSGGRHILFCHRSGVGCRIGIRPGVDLRGDGGYIIVSPSNHIRGTYEWECSSRPGEVELVEWPERWLEAIQSDPERVQKPAPPIEGAIPEGERNAKLTSLAGTMRRRGMSETAIVAALLEENRLRCRPLLPEEEVRQIAASVVRYAPVEGLSPVNRTSVSSVSPSLGESIKIDWAEPLPLPEILPLVEPFELALLPEAFLPWVEDVAERLQCPPDFPAVGAMVVLASVVGRQLGIRPKAADDWTVVPNLWGAVVGRPGVLKTAALQEALKPLERLEAQARDQYETEQKEHEADQLITEERKKIVKEEIRNSLRQDQDEKRTEQVKQAALEIVQEGTEPIRRRYIVNDTTIEKLGEILNGNPHGVKVFRDELIGFLKSLDKDGREGDRAFYLEAWNGTGRFTYDRIGRGTVDIEAACVSILGGIQPGPLSHYVRRMAQGGANNDGLLQRFQLVVWPDLSGTWIIQDRIPNLEARQVFYSIFSRLDLIDTAALGAQQEEGAIPYLRFTSEAQFLFYEWLAELERRVRSGEELDLFEAHLAKYRSLVPSLALLIHLADLNQGPVGELALRRACAWAEYLESHARRIYASALSSDISSAHALANRLQKGDLPSGFTLRELYSKGWHALTGKDEAQAAVDLLEDLGWLYDTFIKREGGGRPTRYYQINPCIVGNT